MWRALTLCALLAACAGSEPASVYREPDRVAPPTLTQRPAFPGYGEAIAAQPLRWNAESVARDFDRLMFLTEWGDDVPVLLRWEKPVTVALADAELQQYRPFLDSLIRRIRTHAPGLDVTVAPGAAGEITLRTAPRAEMESFAANALCFFVPLDADWPAFKAISASDAAVWDALTRYDAITIFIPAFAPPHEVRSCILEEVTQALGPGNDLRDLEDSIFNDDNAHVWPTSFDFLILKTLYNQSLRNGLKPDQANEIALSALRRDPQLGATRRPADQIGGRYDNAIAIAEDETDASLRRQAAQAAISLAQTQGAAPHRLGEAYKAAAFVAFEQNQPRRVIDFLARAEQAHATRLPAGSPHLARVRSELAINLINLELYETGLDFVELAIPVFAANGADWQLAHALRWRAIALSQSGRWAEGSGAAQEALDWARYVYGGDSRAFASWRREFVDIGLIATSG